jgi:hypothetical protein
MITSRRAYYGGRPSSSSSSSSGKKSKTSKKSPKSVSSAPVSSAVLSGIIDSCCVGELNQSGEYQAIKVAVMAENNDSNLGRLSRMSYVELAKRYGMYRPRDRPTTQVNAHTFHMACRKAYAAAKAKQ